MDYSIKIGGEAGQGIQTIGDTLAKVFTRSGYCVFTHQDYESRIRGGHNFYQIRLSDKQVMSSREKIDIIVALDKETIPQHAAELNETGRLIYDSASIGKTEEGALSFMDVPFASLAVEHGGSKIMANTVATGAVMGMLGMELDLLAEILQETFVSKGQDIIDANIRAASAGRDFAKQHCINCSFDAVSRFPSSFSKKMLITGVEGIGFGAVAAGCKFYSAYPMTPSTGIMNYIAGKGEECGIVVEQAEDEISAINMTLGASFAGVRAMTGTSGGGFALMVEGLSLAGMTETPVVIALGQRPGPATGFPTRTEQADLNFALYTAHGEFPRVVFAPGTPEQAFYLTGKAFDLAEKYQIPAIIIFDSYLADTSWTFDSLDFNKINYVDYRLRGDAFERLKEYKRHAFTETGVSPLGVPGDSIHPVVTDSDEHDEDGHMVEDAATRNRMLDKRLFKKLPLIRQEVAPPLLYCPDDGPDAPDVILTGWGSTYGVMKDAVDALSKEMNIAMLHFSELFPFPSIDQFNYLKTLSNAKHAICIENNAGGQFARLMRAETGFEFTSSINKYDGRPFLFEEMVRKVRGKVRGF